MMLAHAIGPNGPLIAYVSHLSLSGFCSASLSHVMASPMEMVTAAVKQATPIEHTTTKSTITLTPILHGVGQDGLVNKFPYLPL